MSSNLATNGTSSTTSSSSSSQQLHYHQQQQQNHQNAQIPQNANTECVGPTSTNAGKASSCEGCPNQSTCASGQYNSPAAMEAKKKQQQQVTNSLSRIHHIILVLSGKGGVGKSTVASQLSLSLGQQGYNVGILDVDICGPSIPRMVGALGQEVHKSGSGWSPVYITPTVCVMSIGFLLQNADTAVVWRGPRKNGMIEQFLTETDWANASSASEECMDYLIIDTPPGTSDEHISLVQFLQCHSSVHALIVTTPEEVSMADVRKEINFCQKTKLNVLGLVENMSTAQLSISQLKFASPGQSVDCTALVLQKLSRVYPEIFSMNIQLDVFSSFGDGPSGMAKKFNIPFLGKIPLDTNLLQSCERGECFVERYKGSDAVAPFLAIVKKITSTLTIPENNDYM